MGRFKFHPIGGLIAVVLASAIAACSPAGEDLSAFQVSTISPAPAIFLIDGFVPEIMGPSQVYEGLWAIEFEGSPFFDGIFDPEHISAQNRFDTWLEPRRSGLALHQSEDPRINQSNESSTEYNIRYLRIKFVGRRNVFPSIYGFGHMGVYDKMILVEKVISAKLVAVK